MTRAAKSPVTRIVQGESGQEYVVRVEGRQLVIRPKGSRDPLSQALLPWDSIYQRALLSRIERPAKPRRVCVVSRGLLATQRRAD